MKTETPPRRRPSSNRRPPARRPSTARRPPARVAPRPTAANPRRRLLGLLVLLCLAFALVVVRLTSIQVLSPNRYAAVGQSQRLRSIVLPAERGAMFDRNGRDLALTLSQQTVWANPHLVTDPAREARLLAPVLGVDEGLLRDRLSRDAGFVYLARKVSDTVANRVKGLHLAGVSFLPEPKRFSPAGDLALPLLGVVGTDNAGLSGLELEYNKALSGHPGALSAERDPTGHRIAAGARRFTPARAGDDLILTIDRSLQYETEQALQAEILASHAKGGIAVVMNPRTGEILAMANFSAAGDGTPPTPSVNNMAVTNVYEPGSVNKVITISAALEEGLVSPSTVLSVPDHMQVADHRFSDHDPHPVNQWTVTDVMANSSNIGTIMIGQRLGKDRIDHYLRAFGLGSKTGLGFPGEPRGLLLDPKKWSGTSIGTVPIGQGLAVTALQMLGAYNTVADDGVWVQPRLVKATVDAAGRQRPTPASASRRVVSVRTARQVDAMLKEVVRVGTGTAAHIDGYTVAGKTGTARKPLEGARGYKRGAYVATFAGFVPAESPKLSAIVVLDEPTPIYGGLVSAPVFAQVAKYALRLLRIPPALQAQTVAVPAADNAAASPTGEFDGATRPSPATTVPPAPQGAPPTTAPATKTP